MRKRNATLLWTLLAGLLATIPARARTIPPAGIPSDPNNASCWSWFNNGQLINTCSIQQEICFGLPEDATGQINVTIRGKQATQGGVQCFVQSAAPDASALRFSGWASLPLSGAQTQMTLSAFVSSDWDLMACCVLQPGANSINSFNY